MGMEQYQETGSDKTPEKGWDSLSFRAINLMKESEKESLIAQKFKNQLDLARAQDINVLAEFLDDLSKEELKLTNELMFGKGQEDTANQAKWMEIQNKQKDLEEISILSGMLTRILAERATRNISKRKSAA
jgi:hypothetical protein